ncbi:MAG: hypothetical protein QMD85_05400, partial [Candidatus Aenigmarchaeota archaeon]|nr:hypothetical protein [Candidatus Aenigmarchaeota archaeon]MDI6723005.1 hypothetical protein [Candidatus Aenigmarchaeota archaeon]
NTYPFNNYDSDCMPILTLDERRRITLPKGVVEDMEQRFVAIKTKEGILLKPLPSDPIKTLEKLGEKLPKDVTFEMLKKAAEEEAEKELGLK